MDIRNVFLIIVKVNTVFGIDNIFTCIYKGKAMFFSSDRFFAYIIAKKNMICSKFLFFLIQFVFKVNFFFYI